MKWDHSHVGSVEVFAPNGALVEDDAQEFAAEMKECVAGPNPRLVLDLTDVPYVDSIALEALVDVADAMDERSAKLRIASTTATVREVLELTGLSKQFQFFEQVQDAVKSFL